jgi:hypothetical protein
MPKREEKSGETQKLKRRIKYLEKKVDRLQKEVKTLESYQRLTNEYIGDKLDGVPVEQVIRGVQKKETLGKIKKEPVIKEACPKCISSKLKIVPYPGGEVKLCRKCDYRETVKK